MKTHFHALCITLLLLTTVGCQSPYHSDQGALLGGAAGAGIGALVGAKSGHAGAGALIGGAAGALTGAVVGNEMDKTEARNRMIIEQQMGRKMAAGAVTFTDIVQMTRAGVNEELIISQVRAHGITAPLTPSDVIRLKQEGVSDRVVQAMETLPPPQAMVVGPPPGPPPPTVIVEGYRPGPYYYGGGYYRRGW